VIVDSSDSDLLDVWGMGCGEDDERDLNRLYSILQC